MGRDSERREQYWQFTSGVYSKSISRRNLVMGLAATVFYNKLIPLAQIFSLPYSGWHGLLFHFCTYRAESVCWVCALRRGTSCPIFPTSASWEGFVQPPTLRHAPLFKTKSLYTRLFSSSLIPKHLKWSWNAMCLYTLGGLLNASWVKAKNKPTKKKTPKNQSPHWLHAICRATFIKIVIVHWLSVLQRFYVRKKQDLY